MSVPKMQLVDWLDDLSVRFIVNLPKEELQSVERICFQVEEAQWYYEDFVRPTNPQLPSMNLRQFCLAIFHHCPLFAGFDVDVYMQAFQEFLAYKSRVPVRGAILLNDAMDEVVLVRGWKKGANWSFPRGKINKAEDDLDCAIREVFEETGLDVNAAGLIPADKDVKSIDVTLREQSIKLFVIPNVSKDTHFEPQTRKEIGSIQWYKLADLPTLKRLKQQQHHHEGHGENLATHANKFYMVAPFLGPLRKIISQYRRTHVDKVLNENGHEGAIYAHGADVPAAFATVPQTVPQGFPLLSSEGSDMDRLLNQLRQSKEAYREQNLPEVSQPVQLQTESDAYPQTYAPSFPPNDAAFANAAMHPQLAALQGFDSTPVQQSPQGDAAAAARLHHQAQLLQTLQGGPPRFDSRAVNYAGQWNQQVAQPNLGWPQTPMEAFGQQPAMPASPTHQHRSHIPHISGTNAPPPPAFPFAPANIQRPHSGVSVPLQSVTTQPAANAAPQWLTPSITPLSNRPRSPAPYQQTGDPEFSMHVDPSARAGPVVPEPSKLPAPKLTANSAKLLSLFTGKQQTSAGPAAEMSAIPHSRASLIAAEMSYNPLAALLTDRNERTPASAPRLAVTDRGTTPALASPTELGAGSPTADRPRTSQQIALLDLFKSQSGRSLGSPSPALAPGPSMHPPPPAELSASQSPAQTFSQFQERRTGSSEALVPPTYGKVTIQKRHAGQPSISNTLLATVTGPLNVSEQELQPKPQEAKGNFASASLTRPAGPNLTPGSVRILSRPGTASGQNKGALSPKQASPKPSRSPRRPRNEAKQQQASPKPFQPQILKRPVDTSAEQIGKEPHVSQPQPMVPVPTTILRRGVDKTSPTTIPSLPSRSTPTIERGVVEAPSPMSRQTSTEDGQVPVSASTLGPSQELLLFHMDGRASQTSEQKASLLSLFSKNLPPAVAPPSITSSPVHSLLGSKLQTPTVGGAPAVSPINAMSPRNRMGSLASIGSGDSLTGRATPQTTNEKDKKFLLGFLNNVASGKDS